MRLFAALLPPAEAVDDLHTHLGRGCSTGDEQLRRTPRRLWHVTLAFYGDDDLAERSAALARQLSGQQAPRLTLAGAGTFRGVLWVGVDGDHAVLAALAGAARHAGTELPDRPFHAHLTLARWSARRPPPRSARRLLSVLDDYRGPTWTADEVVLLRSHRPDGTLTYTPQQRFRLC